MPEPVLNGKTINRLRKIAGKDGVVTNDVELRVYQYDASLDMALPEAVVFPADARQVSQIVHLAAQEGIPYLPRGSGTNLSGGTVPVRGGLVIEFSRMNRVLEIDTENRRVLVEPGVYNLELQEKLAPAGFFYPPDPASQRVSTLGGNIGENSGGPHCLKYGVTTNHVLGLELILPSGQIVEVGGDTPDPPGYDLVGLLVGSEGTLGLVTKAWLRILPLPEKVSSLLSVYDTIGDAARSVTEIVKAGIVPAAMEIMDRPIIHAVEDSVQAGYPRDAEAVLIIDVDGKGGEVDAQVEAIEEICRRHKARELRIARSQEERDGIWSGRRGAFGAVARITPNYLVTDCTVPRTRLPSVLEKIAEISRRAGLPIGNVFHAGDGNLHPLILFDDRNAEERQRADEAGKEIMKVCASMGGTISGEHGIGLEKREAMSLIFQRADLSAMHSVKEAFDPKGILNPEKIFSPGETYNGGDNGPAGDSAPPLEKVLVDLLGSDRAHIPEAISEKYGVGNIIPRVVVYPETEEEISEIVRICAQYDAAMVPKGNGSKTLRVGIPEQADVIVSLNGLNEIVMLDADNFTATIQAGMSYTCLQNTLRAQGLRLPVVPFYASRATVGGMASTGDGGFPNPHHNALRDLVLGMRVVMADGSRAHFGGITMKNVAGYDMCKLYLGSYGTLGIITDITMRLEPAPAEEAVLLLKTENLHKALACCARLSGTCDVDSRVEILNTEATAQLLLETGLEEEMELACRPHRWTVLLHCSGPDRWTEARLNHYEALFKEEGGRTIKVFKGEEVEAVENSRSRFFETSSDAVSLALQVSTISSRIEEIIRAAYRLAGEHRHRVKIASAPGYGKVCMVFTPEYTGLSKEELLNLTVDATNGFKELGCNYHVESAPLNLLCLIETWHNPSHGLAMMQHLKKALDPHNLFNPGKLIDPA